MYLARGTFRSNSDESRLSKCLSWLLRHGAVREGLSISSEGFITVNQVLQHKSFNRTTLSDIQRVVHNNQKQRFTLRENPLTNALEIKANQGHSIRMVSDEGLTPILEPKYNTVVHGTYLKCWPQIKALGLSRMNRRHIHLAKGTLEDTSVVSGLRRNVQVYIFINLKTALREGLKFYESENGVILTGGNAEGYLLPKYFLKAILVDKGYPFCTQPADLVRALAARGAVRVERMTERYAVLRCRAGPAPAPAPAPHVYGTMLTVRPWTQSREARDEKRQQQANKRDFTMTKQKAMIVKPRSIDLSGDFYAQLDATLASVRLTQEEVQSLSRLYADLELALSSLWPGCVCMPFGSITTGLGIKTSDADCFVNIPPQYRHPHANYVAKAKRVLQQHPTTFAELLAIPRANTPIIKFYHLPTATNCDLSFKTPLGAQNSRLITFLLHLDPRLLPIAVLVKYWAKVHDISGTGKLTNYALTMLIIFYVQQAPVNILPSVESLQRDRAFDCMVDHWNTGFMNQKERLPPVSCPLTIAELLGGFFEYYANFDFETLVVCPFLGLPIRKDAFARLDNLPSEFVLYKYNVASELTYPVRHVTSICIQDPFEQSHNVSSGVSQRMAAELKEYFKFAAAAYQAEKAKDCRGFLKKILLEKPKIVKIKNHPEFRISLFPKIVAAIVDDDWKARVREVVFLIFEQIFKLSLGKVEEKTNPDLKKGREKYIATMTRAVWKRRNFAKLYKLMDLPFLEKETRITEEILLVDKNEISLKFQVIITFKSQPNSAVVSVRLLEGDAEVFKDFGHFYMSSLQGWYTTLLRPFSSQKGNPALAGASQNTNEGIPKDRAASELDTSDESDENDEDDVKHRSTKSDKNPASDRSSSGASTPIDKEKEKVPRNKSESESISDALLLNDCLAPPLQKLNLDA